MVQNAQAECSAGDEPRSWAAAGVEAAEWTLATSTWVLSVPRGTEGDGLGCRGRPIATFPISNIEVGVLRRLWTQDDISRGSRKMRLKKIGLCWHKNILKSIFLIPTHSVPMNYFKDFLIYTGY